MTEVAGVRPELQQIRDALDCGVGPWPCGCRTGECVKHKDAVAALARVEASLNAQQAEIERLTTQHDYSLAAFDAAAEAIQEAHRDSGE